MEGGGRLEGMFVDRGGGLWLRSTGEKVNTVCAWMDMGGSDVRSICVAGFAAEFADVV